MKKQILFFVITLISAFFAVACEPGYEETAVVQVVDGRIRPIENATVQIIYQIDKTTNKGYATTLPKTTDSNGMATVHFINQEFLKERVDCEYTIISNYDNQKVEQKVNVDKHGPIITIKMNVYKLNIYAIDQNSVPLANAEIIARELKKTTDNNGRAEFLIASGDLNLTLKYGEGQITKNIFIINDTDYQYQAPIYNLNLYVVDDENNPLRVNATIGKKVLSTNANGYLSVQKLLTAKPAIITYYKGVKKTINVDLATQNEFYIVYDLHAPKITNVIAKDDGKIILNMKVIDEGLRASGITPDGITARYSINGVEYQVPVYVKAKDEYEVLLGNIDNEGIIEFSLKAQDNSGNLRNMHGYFSISYENKIIKNETNTIINVGENSSSIDPIQILGVGVGIIIVLIIINTIKRRFEANNQ
ncbi:MAG: hypothetical protein AB1391_02685 [Candidatus Micrarchaeota archaeon]